MHAQILIAGLLVAISGHAQPITNPPAARTYSWFPVRPMPEGLVVSLVGDRTNYFLGETILLHYRIANSSGQTFTISVGGDYRGGTRADRFEIKAFSAEGKPVADPTPFMRNFGGGMMPGGEIKPGTEWFEKVYVLEYCRFDAPGAYKIRAFHDLGFGPKGTNDPREVEFTIHLQAPSEAEARTILAEAEKAAPNNGTTWGTKGIAGLDYHCIRWPTFLEPLRERAQAGNENALEGIAGIRTLEASRALVTLLKHTNETLAAKAAGYLDVRMPHAPDEFKGPWGEQRKQFVIEHAWEAGLNPPVREYGVGLLERRTREAFKAAAPLLRRVGTTNELPVLMRALEFALGETNGDYLDDIRYPSPVRVCDQLLGAAVACDPALDFMAEQVKTPGQVLVFLSKHAGRERKLSGAEEALLARWLTHPLPYIRMSAIENLPEQIPPSLTGLVGARMEDELPGVRTFAFEAARRMNEPSHRVIALRVLQTANDEWLQRAANDIALKYGARYECAMVWASRFAGPKNINDYAPHHVLQALYDMMVGNTVGANLTIPHSDDEARALRQRWEAFLTHNRAQIESGHRFTIAELPDDLGVRASGGQSVSAGY